MRIFILPFVAGLVFLSCVKNEVVIAPIDENGGSTFKYAVSSDLIINEICASNSGVILDETYGDPDWIELYNKGDSSINLSDYCLSNDSNDIFKWRFGTVKIKPHQYLLVFASGKNIVDIKDKPADDTLFISNNTTNSSRWSDTAVGGKSTVRPNEFPKIIGTDEDGKKALSATFNLVDNRPYGVVEWSAANINLGFSRKNFDTHNDFSKYNCIEFPMTLEKDKLLCIRLVGDNTTEGMAPADGKAPSFIIKGTGVKDDIYKIPLVQGYDGLDLINVKRFSIEAPSNTFGSVKFTIKSMRLTHTGYNLHTNFQLSGKLNRLYLCQTDSTVLDTAQIATVPNDMSMGKLKGKWVLLKRPTPGLENVQEYYNGINKVPFSVKKGGFYDSSVNVILESTDSGEIYYSVDGSEPTLASRKYTGPIQIDSTTVVRFVSIKQGRLSSKIQTETFFVNVVTKLPVISIATDPGALFDPDTGIYVPGPNASDSSPYFGANFWSDKEIPVHIQLFETDKRIRFSENAGGSIMGNWSRGQKKKSLGIKFNEKYGSSELDYPLFSQRPNVHKFKKFVLRNNGSNYGKSMIEDPMMQSLMDDRGMDYQMYRPAVVFINGRYFGLHQLMEAANTDYVYSNYGLKEDQIDFFDIGYMKQGTPQNWNEFNNYLLTLVDPFGTMIKVFQDTSYYRVKQYMDVYNFIDYMSFEIYINNTDWPGNNCRWWRNQTNGKWRWIMYDTDFGFGNIGYKEGTGSVGHNTLAFALADETAPDSWPNGQNWTFLLRTLLQNQSFKEDFVNRFATLIATNFLPERVKSRIDQMSEEIKEEIEIDFPWWGLTPSYSKVCQNRMKVFADERPAYMYEYIQQQFGVEKLYSLTVKNDFGITTVNDLPVKSTLFKGKYFSGIPVRLTVIPPKGRLFKKWSDGSIENPRVINFDKDVSLEALCE